MRVACTLLLPVRLGVRVCMCVDIHIQVGWGGVFSIIQMQLLSIVYHVPPGFTQKLASHGNRITYFLS